MYTKMIISFVNILIVINFVHGIYNGISIPNPSNKMIKFPWMIRIAIFFDLDENGSPLINDVFGGTLITSTHILTVAHPFQKSDEVDGFKKPYQGIAYAGVYSKSEIPDPENCMQHSELIGDVLFFLEIPIMTLIISLCSCLMILSNIMFKRKSKSNFL